MAGGGKGQPRTRLHACLKAQLRRPMMFAYSESEFPSCLGVCEVALEVD